MYEYSTIRFSLYKKYVMGEVPHVICLKNVIACQILEFSEFIVFIFQLLA